MIVVSNLKIIDTFDAFGSGGRSVQHIYVISFYFQMLFKCEYNLLVILFII